MPLEEVPCSSPRPNSQRAHNPVCSSENYVLDVDRFLGRISPVCGAGSQRRTFSEGTGLLQGGYQWLRDAFRRRSRLSVECHKPRQSPAPGFGEKYWSLSGFPYHSFESGGGGFLCLKFGQILAYSAFSYSHFSSPGSLSALMASTGHSGSQTPQSMHSSGWMTSMFSPS